MILIGCYNCSIKLYISLSIKIKLQLPKTVQYSVVDPNWGIKEIFVRCKDYSFVNLVTWKDSHKSPRLMEIKLKNCLVQGPSKFCSPELNWWNYLCIGEVCYNRMRSILTNLDQIWSKICVQNWIWFLGVLALCFLLHIGP